MDDRGGVVGSYRPDIIFLGEFVNEYFESAVSISLSDLISLRRVRVRGFPDL